MSINNVPVKYRILEIPIDTPNFHSIITTYRKWFKIHFFFILPVILFQIPYSWADPGGAPGAPLTPPKIGKNMTF